MGRALFMIGLLITFALVFNTTKLNAHSDATGIVKERMDLMGAIGNAMKSLSKIMRGEVEYDTDRVRELAKSIEGQGGESLTELFPKNSLDRASGALPAIWEDWERFSTLANQLSSFASALGFAAGNDRSRSGTAGTGMLGGQGMMRAAGGTTTEKPAQMSPEAAFFQLADTCSACHKYFRKKK